MIFGARQGKLSGLRSIIASAMAHDLGTFVIPGIDIARARGLDIEASGLHIVASPRHASVLLIIGDIPPSLRNSAAVIYAQMLRPRVILVLGTEEIFPLPTADVMVGLSQQELNHGVRQLRTVITEGAFRSDISDFDASILQTRIEYTCSMHPEIVQNEPGSCPKCGMFLIERVAQATTSEIQTHDEIISVNESAQPHHHDAHKHLSEKSVGKYTCPMHSEIKQDELGACPKCGMDLVLADVYSCSMHPDVKQNEPGSCPKCGMNLVLLDDSVTSTHEQHHSDDQYTCSMHPDVKQNEPGACPKCGMDLVLADVYTCSMHPDVKQNEPGACPKCGMDLVLLDDLVTSTHEQHHSDVQYTCSMHPDVKQNEPGSCPKCGMDLVLLDDSVTSTHEQHHSDVQYTCSMHPDVKQNEPGSCPKCGMDLVLADVQYTCSMHPEVIQNSPGDCPKCGMNLVPLVENINHDHMSMDHNSMNHEDSGFMSMIDVTKDLPRSSDSLQMDWIVVPFGPFFPGLPSGLLLTLTLDGDTVADSDVRSLIDTNVLLQDSAMHVECFIKQFQEFKPMSPVAYQLLCCRALENAAGIDLPEDIARTRIGALERERISSHLGWLALFAQQAGFDWLMKRASSLQLKFQHADLETVTALKPAIYTLIKRLQRTPLLKSKTVNIGRITTKTGLYGPVARAASFTEDARNKDKISIKLGFVAASRSGGDAHARLHLHLDEIIQSIKLIEAAGAIVYPVPSDINKASGNGVAQVETPRGIAELQLTIETGQITAAKLENPSMKHLALIKPMIDQQELGDALIAVGSLDLSPWEISQ